jgi:ACS family sodium-dependent inorganic phosphate cotransporter
MCFLACVIAYTDRVNISVAAVAMGEELGWSPSEKGLVLSSFFAGYLLLMFPAGLLARRYGGHRVLGVAVVAWSLFTLLTPLAAAHSFAALIVARVALGLGEAALFPSTYELYGRWIPPVERVTAVARQLGGVPIGTVLGFLATGWIIGRYGWPMAFYAFGVLGLVWAAYWFARIVNEPAFDPRASEAERTLLAPLAAPPGEPPPVPWRQLLCHRQVFATMLAHFASTWVLYVLLSWLPSYFRDVQHLSIANAGLFSAAPWLTMFFTVNFAGTLSERLVRRGVSVTRTRKLMQLSGLLGSAVFLLLTRDVASPALALLLLCGAAGMLGFTWSGYAPNSLDLAPRYASLLTGISNSIATLPGIIGVAITGWLVETTGTYFAAFLLTAALAVVGSLAYALWFDARQLVD